MYSRIHSNKINSPITHSKKTPNAVQMDLKPNRDKLKRLSQKSNKKI